jgi:hypothetical protein
MKPESLFDRKYISKTQVKETVTHYKIYLGTEWKWNQWEIANGRTHFNSHEIR